MLHYHLVLCDATCQKRQGEAVLSVSGCWHDLAASEMEPAGSHRSGNIDRIFRTAAFITHIIGVS